ncbi:DUF6705 family protein [Chryseobacterium sp. CT-SW4]|uniref:DUF6705 family protein n=1 Tax=Chryseobacterium sp. SW-1 TaxID=3157343 RepID=UPI003B02D388
MRNVILIILTIFSFCLKAQEYPLNTSPSDIPDNAYLKDMNNELDKYVGTWKGVRDGKTYEFNFIKKENVGENIKWDKLLGRLKITTASGILEYDNFNKTDSELELKFFGDNFQKDLKAYLLYFSGDQINCIDYGYTYLRIQSETPNNMSILFLPLYDITTDNCSNFKTTLPSEKLIHLTKQ